MSRRGCRASLFRVPSRKWFARRIAERGNQLAHLAAPVYDRIYQIAQRLPVTANPFRRDLSGNFLYPLRIKAFRALQPGRKAAPTADLFIDTIARINSTQRGVGKVPITGVEAITLVDEARVVFAVARFLPEHGLTSVGVAQPLVDHQHSRKLSNVLDLLHETVGQVIEDVGLSGITDIAGAKL